ncbi:adhesion G-protein coupled receptor G7-like [Octopus sinensis]|uniref:Adhesion G-protein coupled receptor G7-like n=1 Tax=Octopus sinensis TaxID=2607531 RepID=A0A7E6F327_9MOLL|nr:adhesion G-protein coupled receptor G7-like [Octopus sinensis]
MTSYIGCGISFVCLILTIIIHVCSKNLRKSTASKILINLCASLAITNLIFLVGMQPYTSKITAACKAVAALLHYFLLTSLMWMAVIVFKTYQSHFIPKSSILSWGLPAVIVTITLAINYTNNYIRIEHAQVCWLSEIPFYAAFLAPVVTILIFNIIMFFSLSCVLSQCKITSCFNTKPEDYVFLEYLVCFSCSDYLGSLQSSLLGKQQKCFRFFSLPSVPFKERLSSYSTVYTRKIPETSSARVYVNKRKRKPVKF